MIQSTVLMFGSFGTLSMGLTATKYVAELKVTDPARAGRIIAMSSLISWSSGTVMGLLVAGLAPWLAASLSAPHLTNALRLAAIGLVFNVISEAQLGALSGFEAFKRRSLIQFYASAVSLPILICGVYWWGLVGAICAQVISATCVVCLNSWGIRQEAARHGVTVDLKGASKERQVFSAFTLPTFLGGLMYVPILWLGNTLIVNGPNGYAEMGLFSAADRWRTAIMFLPGLLGGVALPMLTNLRSGIDSKKYGKVLSVNIMASSGAALTFAIPIAILSPWIMASYGSEFAGGYLVLVILCFSCVASAADWMIGQSLFSRGLVWLKFCLNAVWAMVFLTGVWFMRNHGAVGLAMALLFADCSRLAADIVIMKRLSGSGPGLPARC